MTRLTWSHFPRDVREALYALYDDDQAIQEIAEATGMPAVTLKRRLRDFRDATRSETVDTPEAEKVREIVSDTLLRAVSQERSVPRPACPSPLTDLQVVNLETDQPRYIEWLYDMRESNRHISVMHMADTHRPFDHAGAKSIFFQLVSHVQPHLVVVGSDYADFPMLSNWPKDEETLEEARSRRDVLEQLAQFWADDIGTIKRLSPDTRLVYVLGNHERWLWKHVLEKTPDLRETVFRRFIEIIRHDGDVWWLGKTDSVRVGPLLVTHGNRVGKHTAYQLLEDAKYQVSVMAGHIHMISNADALGEDYAVSGMTSGCLCLPHPHYKEGQRMTRKWQLGTGIADVDLQGREVCFSNLNFHQEPDHVWTRFERRIFQAEQPLSSNTMLLPDLLNQLGITV